MSWLQTNVFWISLAIVALSSGVTGYRIGSMGVEARWNAEKAAQSAAMAELAEEGRKISDAYQVDAAARAATMQEIRRKLDAERRKNAAFYDKCRLNADIVQPYQSIRAATPAR